MASSTECVSGGGGMAELVIDTCGARPGNDVSTEQSKLQYYKHVAEV